ncbi:MAG: hypothetical protein H0V14_05785 [Chitinophagaceae bacterium]|nr:hypothetical protein [Chitinophagaceae bacterium]
MPTRVIRITGSNPSDGSLTLDYPNLETDRGDTVLWQYQQSGVYSITLIKEKSSTSKIWSKSPQKRGNNWTGDISDVATDYAEYEYSIFWKASENGPEYKHDPKISINPSVKIL